MAAAFFHSYIQVNIAHELKKLNKYNVFSELTVVVNDKDYISDIALYPKRKIDFFQKDIIKVKELPLLAVEILSPSQTIMETEEKIEVYLKAGVKSCWLVIPSPSSVTVFDNPTKKKIFYPTETNLIDSALDITVPLDSIFG